MHLYLFLGVLWGTPSLAFSAPAACGASAACSNDGRCYNPVTKSLVMSPLASADGICVGAICDADNPCPMNQSCGTRATQTESRLSTIDSKSTAISRCIDLRMACGSSPAKSSKMASLACRCPDGFECLTGKTWEQERQASFDKGSLQIDGEDAPGAYYLGYCAPRKLLWNKRCGIGELDEPRSTKTGNCGPHYRQIEEPKGAEVCLLSSV